MFSRPIILLFFVAVALNTQNQMKQVGDDSFSVFCLSAGLFLFGFVYLVGRVCFLLGAVSVIGASILLSHLTALPDHG